MAYGPHVVNRPTDSTIFTKGHARDERGDMARSTGPNQSTEPAVAKAVKADLSDRPMTRKANETAAEALRLIEQIKMNRAKGKPMEGSDPFTDMLFRQTPNIPKLEQPFVAGGYPTQNPLLAPVRPQTANKGLTDGATLADQWGLPPLAQPSQVDPFANIHDYAYEDTPAGKLFPNPAGTNPLLQPAPQLQMPSVRTPPRWNLDPRMEQPVVLTPNSYNSTRRLAKK